VRCCILLRSARLDVGGHGFDVVAVSTGNEVAVQVHCDLDRGVPELATDGGDGYPPAQHQAGIRVARIMDSDVLSQRKGLTGHLTSGAGVRGRVANAEEGRTWETPCWWMFGGCGDAIF
jgi:hypothetical protein